MDYSTRDENERQNNLKIIHAIYLHTIGKQIMEEADIEEGKFRKPFDTPAFRIASEYVAHYLYDKIMTNTLKTTEKETDNYVRMRHDEQWLERKLRVDPGESLIEALLQTVPEDTHSSRTFESTSSRKIKPKSRGLDASLTGSDAPRPLRPKKETQTATSTDQPVDFIESQDFSQFTNVLTTTAGGNYDNDTTMSAVSGMTFTELDASSTDEFDDQYDPRGVNAKPKPLPKLTKREIQESKFKQADFETTVTQTVIDTIGCTADYNEHKKIRRELKDAGIIDPNATTMTTYHDTLNTEDSFLKPHPRYIPETVDPTWMELEAPPTTQVNVGQCPFAKDFQDIVARKKKMVSMGMQTSKQYNDKGGDVNSGIGIAPAPPLPTNILDAAAAPQDVRQQVAHEMLGKVSDELEP